MKYCLKCGMRLEDDTRFCPTCGSFADIANDQPNTSKQYDFSDKISQLNNTPDTTYEYDPIDIEKNKAMAILAYLIFLIPLLAAKESRFARFHTNQGLIIFILSVASSLVVSLISIIVPVLSIIGSLISLAVVVLTVIGIVNAANGKAKELPLVGNIKIIKY